MSSSFVCILISLVKWSSLSKFDRVSSSSLGGILVKSTPGFCSILFKRPIPGGVMRSPFGFSQRNFPFARSSIAAIPVVFCPGKNVTVSLRPLRYSGKQTFLVYDGIL